MNRIQSIFGIEDMEGEISDYEADKYATVYEKQ